jgi:hypothetical protein
MQRRNRLTREALCHAVARALAHAAAVFLLAGVLAILGQAGPAAGDEVKPLDHPAYKLYSICSEKMTPTEEDLRRLALNFVLCHGKFTKAQNEVLHRFNPDFKSLTYINSTYTRSVDDVGYAETKCRTGLCMLLAGRLAEALAAADTHLRVVPAAGAPKAGKDLGLPNRASTVEGDFSSTDPARPSTKFYVFWIRIGDEFMRVGAFDPATGKAEVRRGFSGSTPAAHAAGVNVFSPVYLGFKRTGKDEAAGEGLGTGFIQPAATGPAAPAAPAAGRAAPEAGRASAMADDADPDASDAAGGKAGKYPGEHPDGPGNRLRYVLDPNASAGNLWKADIAIAAMRDSGVDGVWLDTFNCGTFNLSDCLGRKARAWNFLKNQVYDFDDFREAQERKVACIQETVHQKLDRWPCLVANNLHNYEPGQGGMKLLLVPTAIKPRPLDGFCMEGGLALRDADGWRERMQLLADAAQKGLAVMPVWGGAGAKSSLSEADTPERDRAEHFAYAGYLLAVEKGGKTVMGTYAFYQAGGKRFVKVHPMYYWPIGDPAQTVKPAEFDKYLVAGTEVYRRAFTGGLVFVNPSTKAAEGLVLGGEYLDPDTAKTVTTVTLPAGTGKILLKR